MALKGYATFSEGDRGKELALNICTSCKYFKHDEGSSHPYLCESGKSDSAARQLTHDKQLKDCEVFERVKSEKKDKSKGSGRKKPLWLRIICFPCCCLWHSEGCRNPSGGCKKACNW